MPLIRSAVAWTTHKVSDSVSDHQGYGEKGGHAPDYNEHNPEDSLSRQDKRDPYNSGTDQTRYEGQFDPQQQSTRASDVSSQEWTSAPPSYAHNQDERKSTGDNLARPDSQCESRSAVPPLATMYAHPGQQYVSAQQDYASEDHNRADYYQAKYYESQRSQGQYQAQSAQYGGDYGMDSHQQTGRRGGFGGGMGRGRGRRGRGGLISMLMNK